ncbi:MAG: hypothetical protein Q4B42_02040 [Oscillospiraceae bacterium]|nr:hypothetical protein [Oscillospiraceae bacterium]
MKSILKNGWSDPRSALAENTGVKKGVHGSFWYNDIEFKFTANEQKSGSRYERKGQLSVLSPVGKTLDVIDLYLRTGDRKELREKVERKAAELYAKYERTLTSQTRDSASLLNMHSMRAFTAYNGPFLNMRSLSKKYRADQKRKLKYVCSLFDNKPLGKISVTDIRKSWQKLGSDALEDVQLMGRFWDFCKSKGACVGDNPFTEFRKKQVPKKKRGNTARLQKATGEQKVFDKESKLKSLGILKERLEDGRCMAILLIGDGGLSSSQAAHLRWNDLVFDEQDYSHVTLKIYQPDRAGATHDYTHPMFAYAGRLLHMRFDLLAERYSPDKLANMPVVSKALDAAKPLGQRGITEYCRAHLTEVFGRNKDFEREPMAPEGAGVQFLQRDFRNRLEDICGMKAYPEAVIYMMGGSLSGDVTTDHYCSYSGPDGQHLLWTYLCRERRFDKLFEEGQEDEEYEEGAYYKIQENPDERRSIFLKGAKPGFLNKHKLRLGPFENVGNVEIKAEHGINVCSATLC